MKKKINRRHANSCHQNTVQTGAVVIYHFFVHMFYGLKCTRMVLSEGFRVLTKQPVSESIDI